APRRNADIDLVRKLARQADILHLRSFAQGSLNLCKIARADCPAFAKPSHGKGLLAGENFIQLEGNSPQRVFRVLKEELVERRLQAEKRTDADRHNKKNIGEA